MFLPHPDPACPFPQQQFIIYLKRLMSMRAPQTKSHVVGVDEQLIHAFQAETEELHKMKEQNRILTSLNDKVVRKDQEIEGLQRTVAKYRKYYDEYELIKATLNQKTKDYDRLGQENKILFAEMNQVVAENKQMQEKLLAAEKMKLQFVKERNASDNRLRGIQETFREYQDECKNKEKELLYELEKAYRQIKDLNTKVDDLHSVKFENEQLKAKITNYNTQQMFENDSQELRSMEGRENYPSYINHNTSTLPNAGMGYSLPQSQTRNQANSKSRQRSPNKSRSAVLDLEAENERLKKELAAKELELQRSKALNHELSIEFDKSVNKICEFERELSNYRKQNHELKKTLSLFVEKEQYEKMHRNRMRGDSSHSSQDEEEDDYSDDAGGFSHSHR